MQQKKRQLAAIMFTDIAGYSAMMQADEQIGRAKARRYRQVLEQQVGRHQGEIIQHYGDGSLTIFSSAVEALRCARDIQLALREKPQVPLRIGIHIGDIAREDDDIYGDGVNIASRVESMGVPGSVLVTERVIHDLRSHPEFAMASLGQFAFKNIERPMEVFALTGEGLAVPDPRNLGDKTKAVSPSSTPGHRRPYGLKGVGMLIVAIAVLLWLLLPGLQVKEPNLLPEKVREERVAVAILSNATGDEKLDALGSLASYWLSSALRQIGIKTVSPEMVQQYHQFIGVLPNDPEGRTSFSEITGAAYVLTGMYSFYGQNQDSILLQSYLISAETNEPIHDFPDISGPKDEIRELVEEVRQRLLGYWAIRQDFQLPSTQAPRYEAYQVFMKCRPPEFPCYREAVALDSNFLLARVFLLQAAAAFDQDSIYRANEAYIRKNWANCTTYEKNYFQYITAEQQLDFEVAFQAIDANYQMDPKNIFMINESGVKAWWLINRPDICLDRFERLFNHMDNYEDQLWPRNFNHYLQALNYFRRHQEVIDFVNQFGYDKWFEKVGGTANYEIVEAFISLHRFNEAITFYEAWHKHRGLETIGPDLYSGIYSRLGYVFATTFPNEKTNPFLPMLDAVANNLLSPEKSNYAFLWLSGFPPDHPAKAHYILEDLEEAEALVLRMRDFDWYNMLTQYTRGWVADVPLEEIRIPQTKMQIEGLLGCIYARQGKKGEALTQIQTLDTLQAKAPPTRSIFLFGKVPYLQARIYAILGEKEAAVAHLKKAMDAGIMNDKLTDDIDLVNLRGYEPYEALVRPKLPSIKH